MTKNNSEILSELTSFIQDFTENENLVIDTDTQFNEIPNWDSLAFVATINYIKTKYNSNLNTEELLNLETVGQLVTMLSES